MGRARHGQELPRQGGARDLKLVEIRREDVGTLPRYLAQLRETKGERFILFCDDLSEAVERATGRRERR
jgi:predicted AAA+ superfamily ATPase